MSDPSRSVKDVRQPDSRDDAAARLSLALDAARLGDWEWDAATDGMRLSARAAEIFGVTVDHANRMTRTQMRDLLEEEFREPARRASVDAAERGGDYDIQYRIRRPDGARAWVAARGRGIHDASGKIVRMIGMVQDITARKAAEEALRISAERLLESERTARNEAERASRTKDEFLAILSHELRTPLNAIMGWSQILSQPDHSPEDLAEGLSAIARNARSQAQIVDDLLDMSRIVSGKLRLHRKPVDMRLIVTEGLQTIHPMAAQRNIELTSSVEPEAMLVIGDPGRLQQIIWNLVSNAVKFTPAGGRVIITVRRHQNVVLINVSDTGVGIAQDFLPYIFDRFRQADSSTTRRHGGLGLGLAIVKQLVELHHGAIGATSAGVDAGATFTVTLPLAVARAEPGPDTGLSPTELASALSSAEVLAARTLLRGNRALVVDDDPDSLNVVRRILEDCDCVVCAVSSADEAMSTLDRETFDVLLSDVGLPREDGHSLLRRVRQLAPEKGGNIPALALTAYAHPEDRDQSISAGFQDHVVKPFDAGDLIRAVARLVGPEPASIADSARR